ncbi:MAG: AbfB domain-containing protein [Verrucomicrobiota bacterium]
MKSLLCSVALLFLFLAQLGVFAEIPASLKSLAWKSFAQEIADDVTFRAEVRKILAGLENEKKAEVAKCIAQIVAGKGLFITGTPVDDLLAKALRERGKVYSLGESHAAIDQLTDMDILTLAGDLSVAGQKEAAAEVKLILVADPTIRLNAPRAGRVLSHKIGNRIRVVPGLSNPDLVSLESIQSNGAYLHHESGKIFVTTRPAGTQDQTAFDIKATFKMIKMDGGKVRFEAADRAGEFIRVAEDGGVVLGRISSGERATFRLETKGPNDD